MTIILGRGSFHLIRDAISVRQKKCNAFMPYIVGNMCILFYKVGIYTFFLKIILFQCINTLCTVYYIVLCILCTMKVNSLRLMKFKAGSFYCF